MVLLDSLLINASRPTKFMDGKTDGVGHANDSIF